MTNVCKCRFCRSDAVRVETNTKPYGGAVESFHCLLCRATTARVAAPMPGYFLPALRKSTDPAPKFALGASG